MSILPTALYTAQQVRELDYQAIHTQKIPGIVLMKRAGRATFEALIRCWPKAQKITVYCGAGNNGGDGYIVAALAQLKGFDVEVIQVAASTKMVGDARAALVFAERSGVKFTPLEEALTPLTGIVVDALLGTGLQGVVRATFSEVISTINATGLPVVAVDIPSGLCSDTGTVLGVCVEADVTVSFIGIKQGLMTGHGPAASGELVFDDLGVPVDTYSCVDSVTTQLDWSSLYQQLPLRPADSHKGSYGHVMVIGGDYGYGGAVIMAAEAALRAGAGLVSVATRPEHVGAVLARCPEVMAVGVASGQALEPLLSKPTVIVIGPGLGRSPWSEQMLQKAVGSGLPMIVDADALNILSEGRVAAGVCSDNWILTPHPGEAARLLGVSVEQVQADRFRAVHELQQKFNTVVLLKGVGTLVASEENQTMLCPYGNPGMASGGMGDLLSGILGGLVAQKLPQTEAVVMGVCLHSLAADDAVKQHGQRGLTATDLLPFVRTRLNQNNGQLLSLQER